MSTPPLPFKVKATVSWPGEEDGDLGFLEGELIEVYSVVDESWWSGKLRRNGAEGIFPRDYVNIIEDQYRSSKSNTPISTVPSTPVKEYNSPLPMKHIQSSRGPGEARAKYIWQLQISLSCYNNNKGN